MPGLDSFRQRHLLKWWLAASLSRLIAWRVAPRSAPISFCLVFHSERFHEEPVYSAFLRFLEAFHRITGTRAIVCVLTPRCPEVQVALRQHGVSEEVFTERMHAIAAHSHIGYHGHFYRDGDPGAPIVAPGPHGDSVRRQFDAEVEWLSQQGFPPRLYSAGWWYMDAAIVERLVTHRFQVDFSTWGGEKDPGTGRRREGHDAARMGDTFILPGTESLLEIPSLFGPSDHPFWLVKRHLPPLLARDPCVPLYGALPTHDWNVPDYATSMLATIRFFHRNPQAFAWRDITAIESEARATLRT